MNIQLDRCLRACLTASILLTASACTKSDDSTNDIAAETDTQVTQDMMIADATLSDVSTTPEADTAPPIVDAAPPVIDMNEATDMASVDAAVVVDMMQPLTRIDCDYTISLSAPNATTFKHIDEEISFTGVVEDNEGMPVSGMSVHLLDPRERTLGDTITDEDGTFNLTLTADSLGQAPLSAEPVVILENGFCGPNVSRKVYRCIDQFEESFDMMPVNWTMYGDAFWDQRGWLEMTGNDNGQKGAVYNDIDAISSGLASIEFVMSTGGGRNGGADGFALTIIDILDASELQTLLEGASAGGGLGYGVAPPFGQNDYTWVGDALTVEIDTWYNDWPNLSADPEPTRQNHIALTRNANPSDHIVWHAVPTIEDLMPTPFESIC